MKETYDVADGIPPQFDHDWTGPKGLALVKSWPDGRTDPGWGLQGANGSDGFIKRYMRGEFNSRRVLYGYDRGRWSFAWIMRSVQLVCIDIDGKNGGLEHAKRLGALPRTMAETSRSGNGYHLFYRTGEEWDLQKGFAALNDRIGIEQGVDVRAVGCVYHHDTQRWNNRVPAEIPEHLVVLLKHRDQMFEASTVRIDKILANQDDMEVLMLHDEILTDLAKPIPHGKRNVTLFAIGNHMRQAQIEHWESLLEKRALEVGLDSVEAEKIIRNINHYGSPVGTP
jgi:hypothetical protein